MSEYTLDPGARLDYGVDWSEFLAQTDGDIITLSEWVDVTDGLIVQEADLIQGSIHVAFFASASIEVGKVARATSRITTQQGRIARTTLVFTIKE